MTSVDEDAENPFVHGHCEPGFARVGAGFARMLASGFEVGAALAVYVGAHPVVDLWGGHADAARTRPWERHTIVNLYSVGKAVGAICVLRLVEAGVLDLDAPVGDLLAGVRPGGQGARRGAPSVDARRRSPPSPARCPRTPGATGTS